MQAALGLVLLAILVWLGYLGLSFLIGSIAAIPPAVLGPLLVASGTVLGVVITVVGGQVLQRRAAHEEAHRPKKVELYEQFMQHWFGFLEFGVPPALRKGIQAEDPALVAYFAEFAREVILWGSNKVVADYSNFTRAIRALPGGEPLTVLLGFEGVLLAMRRDLGHTNRGLKKGDVLRLFITDIDQVLGAKQSKSISHPADRAISDGKQD